MLDDQRSQVCEVDMRVEIDEHGACPECDDEAEKESEAQRAYDEARAACHEADVEYDEALVAYQEAEGRCRIAIEASGAAHERLNAARRELDATETKGDQ